MFKKTVALALAVWVAFLPALALAQSANTVGNDANATATGGIRILGSDGTNDYKFLVDSSGRLIVSGAGVPVFETIQHVSNKTVAASLTVPDSSATPVLTSGYTKVFAFVRFREATMGKACLLDVRGHLTAQIDSTQGWWFRGLGTGGGIPIAHGGKVIPIVNLSDRFQMIALVDSINGTPFQSPYMSINFWNISGAQVKYDLWFMGVR